MNERVTFGRAGTGRPVHVLKSKQETHGGAWWAYALCGKWEGPFENVGAAPTCTECCQIFHDLESQKTGSVKEPPVKDAKLNCDREDGMRKEGWVPEISLTVWAQEGNEDRTIHYHGPKTIMDYTSLIHFLSEQIIKLEHERETHE